MLPLTILCPATSAQDAAPDTVPDTATLPVAELVFEAALQRADLASQPLLDMARAGDRLVAVGDSGLIILSDDNGQSWRQATVPVSATLTAVDFPGAQRGWAVGHGGIILHTTDAGDTWNLQFDGRRVNEAWLQHTIAQRAALEAQIEELEAQEDADATLLEDLQYALDDAIFNEEDAQGAIETGPVDPFLDVHFLDEQRGFAAGAYGMFYATVDGGESWQIQVAGIENPDRFHLYAIHSVTEQRIFLAGEAGLLYRSDDGGKNFQRYYDVYDGSLFGLLPLGEGVIAYGLRGNLFVQHGGDEVWEPLESSNRNSLYGGGVLEDGGLVLLGAGGVALRVDPKEGMIALLHPARITFSAALPAPDGTVWLAGVEGLARLDEAHVQ